jgi:hypothetical protein
VEREPEGARAEATGSAGAAGGASPDGPVRLPFEPGDVCVQAHANGAVVVVDSEYRSRFVPLAEAVDLAAATGARGGTVFLAQEDDSPLAVDAIAAVRGAAGAVQDYGTLIPPFRWPNGTTALMTAAAHGQRAVLVDLVARGADLSARDDAGSTALHHAAGAGDLEAVDVLLDAGADVDAVDHAGLTALAVAAANGRDDVVGRLTGAGADPAAAAGVGSPSSAAVDGSGRGAVAPTAGAGAPARRFSASHWVPPLGDVYLAVIVAGLVVVLLRSSGPAIAVGAAVGAVAVALAALRRSRLYWAGGVARRLEGTVLVTRRLTGGTARIDLRHARAATLSRPAGFRQLSARLNGRVLVLVQDELGPLADAGSIRRLDVPLDEARDVAAAAPRAFGVILGLGATDEVLRAVGPVLVGNDAYLPAPLRQQIAAAQRRG